MDAATLSLILKGALGLIGTLVGFLLKSMHDKIDEQKKSIDSIKCQISDLIKDFESSCDESALRTEKELAKLESKVNEKFLNHLKAHDRRIDDIFKETSKIPLIQNQTSVNSTEIEWLKKER